MFVQGSACLLLLPYYCDPVTVVEGELHDSSVEEYCQEISGSVIVVSVVHYESVFRLWLQDQLNVVPKGRRIAKTEIGQMGGAVEEGDLRKSWRRKCIDCYVHTERR